MLLLDAAAEFDDDLMEKYLNGEEITAEANYQGFAC